MPFVTLIIQNDVLIRGSLVYLAVMVACQTTSASFHSFCVRETSFVIIVCSGFAMSRAAGRAALHAEGSRAVPPQPLRASQ